MELLGLFRPKGNFKARGKQLKLHTDPAHPSSPARLMPSDFKAHMKVYLQKSRFFQTWRERMQP